MRLALGGVVVAAVALAGCGGSSELSQRRDAVNAYFERVNRAENPLLAKSGEVDYALRHFSLSSNTPSETRALLQARTLIRTTLKSERAIHPPPDARSLHADLIRLLALQAAVTDELVQTTIYVPKLASLLRPLSGAAAKLGKDIAVVKPPVPSPKVTGAELWTAAACGSCHSLAAAKSNGSSGPDLDLLRPASAVVAAKVRGGGKRMPSYARAMSAAQIATLASYVSSVAGGSARSGAAIAPSPAVSAANEVYRQYGSAFAHYRLTIVPVARQLDALKAPPELRPGLLAQRQVLHESVTHCLAVEQALRKHDVKAANAAIRSLFTVASGVNAVRIQKQQAAAVSAYEVRIKKIATLAARVAQKRQALVTKVG